MQFEIIDFHTHPFMEDKNNICSHTAHCDMNADNTLRLFEELGVSKICGSVIERNGNYDNNLQKMKHNNDEALKARDYYNGFYIPGFHVHPDYVEESINEIHRMHREGVNLIGELVPYMDGWSDYSCDALSEILREAGKYNMIVSFHSMGEDEMDKMVQNHKEVIFVAAHPGEYNEFMRHMDRAKRNDNYYLDLSGYGIHRHGMLRHAIDVMGADRILFGSDYPTCNPAMYIGGVLMDNMITDTEKERVYNKVCKLEKVAYTLFNLGEV